jgi:hypothetical protein
MLTPEPDVLTVALLKGAVEGDPTLHFASLLGFRHHVPVAQATGVLAEDGETPTALARDIYHRYRLDQLPPGRAYLAWHGSPVVAAVIAELLGISEAGRADT